MLLVDVGSTYTKIVAIDPDSRTLLGSARAPTTIDSDVSIGFKRALDRLRATFNISQSVLKERFASSSAAGGLKMVAIGLVPDLTVEAARRAALGAGAKLVSSYGYKLNSRQIRDIEKIDVDIILLTGGTNGGDQDTILHNARQLAHSAIKAPIIIAGNESVNDEVEDILKSGQKEVRVTMNVLPEIDKLQVEPARELIREVFLSRIIYAKGLDKIQSYIDCFLMPTPMAVLMAAKIFADVQGSEVMVVDVGGATTDVHSVAEGFPQAENVIFKGLPEPRVKRTVEGDLGVRHNLSSIIEVAGREKVLSIGGIDNVLGAKCLDEAVEKWSLEHLPVNEYERSIDVGLAGAAIEIAVNRHAGYVENIYLPQGQVVMQYGKDLTGVNYVVGTGGPIVNSSTPRQMLRCALYNPMDPSRLKPKNPRLFVDANYLMYAAGLMMQTRPTEAYGILTNYLKEI